MCTIQTGMLFLCIAFVSAFYINQRTCLTEENLLTFEIVELVCSYRGPGLYVYDGPSTVQKLKFDRMTTEGHIRIPKNAVQLEEIQIMKGTEETCETVSSPPHVTVKVGDKVCVSKLMIISSVCCFDICGFFFVVD